MVARAIRKPPHPRLADAFEVEARVVRPTPAPDVPPRTADALVEHLLDEHVDELGEAVYVVPDVVDVDALSALDLAAALAGQPAHLVALARGAAARSIVLVGRIDAGVRELLRDELPDVDVLALRDVDSPAAALGYVGGVGPTWTPSDVAAKRRTWLTLARSARMEVPATPGDETTMAPFPVDVLPTALRDLVVAGAAAQGVDVAYWGVPAVGILAGCIGTTRSVRLKAGWIEPAIVWAAVIAPSGAGKSPPLDALLAPVREHDYALHERWLVQMESFREARAAKQHPEPPPMLQALVDDVTLEALLARHEANSRGLLLCVDELAGWVRSFNKYRSGGGDEQTWLSIHGGRAAKVDRKGGSDGPTRIYLRRTAVSVAGTIQPSVAAKYLGAEESIGSGMAARLLLARPPVSRAMWNTRCVDPATERDYGRLARSMLNLLPDSDGDPVVLDLDANALAEFVAYHDENGHATYEAAVEDDEGLAAALSKLRAAAPRLALVFALCRAAGDGTASMLTTVDREAMRGGIALARWFEHEARRIYVEWADHEDDDKPTDAATVRLLAERLRKFLSGGPKTRREMHAGMGGNVGAAMMRAALAQLAAAGEASCERSVGPRGGRPAERWRGVCS